MRLNSKLSFRLGLPGLLGLPGGVRVRVRVELGLGLGLS